MGLLDNLYNQIVQLLSPIIAPIKGIVSLVTHFKDNTVGLLSDATKLVQDAETEYKAIINFKTHIHAKSRVIQAERAYANIKRLVSEVPQSFIAAVKGLVQELKQTLKPQEFNLQELEGVEDLRSAIGKLGSRLAAGFEKLLGVLGIIAQALDTIHGAIQNLQTIIDDIKEVREDIENLDGIFLPQNNKRRTITSEIGKMRIREGALHD